MDKHQKQLIKIIQRLEEMLEVKQKEVKLLKMSHFPDQRSIEITQGELAAITKIWNMVGEVIVGPKS